MTKPTTWPLCPAKTQPGHPPSLIRVFAVPSKDSQGPKVSSSDSEDSDQTGHQTGGCPGGSSESTLGALHFVGFVVRQLNFSVNIDAWGVHFYEKIDSSESKKQACLEGIYDCGTSKTPSSFCFFSCFFFFVLNEAQKDAQTFRHEQPLTLSQGASMNVIKSDIN